LPPGIGIGGPELPHKKQQRSVLNNFVRGNASSSVRGGQRMYGGTTTTTTTEAQQQQQHRWVAAAASRDEQFGKPL
jgi:hypothetical protein